MAKFDWSKYQVVNDENKSSKPSFNWNKYQSLPESSKNSGSFLSNLENAAINLGADIPTGISRGTASLLNVFPELFNKVLGSHVPTIPEPESFNKMLGLGKPNTIDKLVQGGASYVPSAVTGSGLASLIGKGIDLAPKAFTGLSDLLGGSLYGASQDPNNMLKGAELGAALNKVGDMISPAFSSLLPSILNPAKSARSIFRNSVKGKGNFGEITPEEFKANLSSVPGNIKVPLGDVANSGNLKNTYGIAQAIPFSGASAPYEQLNTDVRSKLASLNPNDIPNNVGEHIFNQLKNGYENAKFVRSNAYNQLDAALNNANQLISSFNREPLDSALQKAKQFIGQKAESKTGQRQYSDVMGLISDLDNKSPTMPLNNFSDADQIRQLINNEYKNALSPDKKQNKAVLDILHHGIENTVNKNLDNLGENSSNIKQLSNAAKKAHLNVLQFERTGNGAKAPISPFKKAYDTTYNNPDYSSFINSYLPQSGNSRPTNRLNSLLRNLPENDRSLLGTNFLFNPEQDEKLNPIKVINRYSKLTPGQKQSMFGDNKQTLDNLSKLKSVYPEIFNTDYVPKTGLTGNKALTTLAAVSAGHFLPLTAAIGTPLATGQSLQRVLRSDFLKNQYLKALQEKYPNFISKSPAVTNLIKSMLVGNSIGDNK